MSCFVWRKNVEIWLTAVILTVISPVSRCADTSINDSSSFTDLSFPNEPPCHILHSGETLMLRCEFDHVCEKWWCHQEPGTTAYLILPQGDSAGHSIFTRTYPEPGSSRAGQMRSESVLLVERTSILDAGQYLCVCAAKNMSYKIEIAVVNVSARVQPRCNRRVELTFNGMVQPIDLTVYKWICRPFSARLIDETIEGNSKRLEIELDIGGDTSSTVACYFYLKSPRYSCGVRVVSVAFQIHTKDDMCNLDFLHISTATSVTFLSDGLRRVFLLFLTVLLTFVIGQGRFQEDGVITRFNQLHSLDLS